MANPNRPISDRLVAAVYFFRMLYGGPDAHVPVEPTSTGLMHRLLAINPLVSVAVELGAVAFRGWFRTYTVVTIVLVTALAIAGFPYLSAVVVNEPTPWMGVIERAAQYALRL